MAKVTDAAKTPVAKPATKAAAKPATKPAAKPAAEKKPRVRRTAAQIAEDKQKAQGAQLPLDTTASSASRTSMAAANVATAAKPGSLKDERTGLEGVRPQATAMTIQGHTELHPALKAATHAEIGGYASLPKADQTGAGKLSPEEAMRQAGMGEVNPKADTENLTRLHEVETAKLLVGQSLDALRAIQVAKQEEYRADCHYGSGSREKSLVRWARYFGVEMTAMIWINGDVKAVTKAFDLNQRMGVYFPQHAHPFHYDVYDVNRPEQYKGYNGILIQPFDFDGVWKKTEAFQQASGFEATLEIADRIALTEPLQELKRGDVLRSILNPSEHIIVLESTVKAYFVDRGYGSRGMDQPKGDILGVQLTFSKSDPFEPIQLMSYGSAPQYFHSTLFERVKRLKLTSPNADFDGDELNLSK